MPTLYNNSIKFFPIPKETSLNVSRVVAKFFGLAQKSDRRATRRLRDDEDDDDDDVDEGGPTKDRQRVAKESG